MSLYLSRLTLRRDPSTAALRGLLDPKERARAMDAHHRLIWSLFADHPDRQRDFLWRADGQGRFYALSARAPAPAPLFEPPEVKEFAPELRAGDRLTFALRANATRSRTVESLTEPGETKKQRVDLVMDALYPLKGGRAEARMTCANEAAQAWMTAQGAAHGFSLGRLEVDDYSVMALPRHRGPRKRQPQFGVLDMTGDLTVENPDTLLSRIAQGFGRAKSFGCGLMLIRRAP